MLVIGVPVNSVKNNEGTIARPCIRGPVPNEAYSLLPLLAHELAVLHLLKQLLFSFGARKKHTNAERYVKL